MSSILLKNGTILIHDENDHVVPTRTDVLIENDLITQISPNLSPLSSSTTVIDITDKVVSPGFVDTHHHLWQSQLRGQHGNDTLLNYFPLGNFSSSLYSEDDLFWGQLAGCLEAIDCGTTTVVDFAHNASHGPNHGQIAIDATAAVGLRSIFCFAPSGKVTDWQNFTIEQNPLKETTMETFKSLVRNGPYGEGRVTVGFAFDGFGFLPKENLDQLMATLEELKVPLITAHYVPGPTLGHYSLPAKLEESKHLDSRWLMSHASNGPASDLELYRKRGVHFSTTVSTEFQMSMGFPAACFDPKLPGAKESSSLGIDCHSACSAFIPGEARLALQSARGAYGQQFLDKKKQPRTLVFEVEEAFNQATIRGARAAKMEDKIGSIKVGKLADLVIFDSNSPSMLCAVDENPVNAIILHSSPKDIDAVIVGGKIRKQDGRLLPTSLGAFSKRAGGKSTAQWRDVVQALKASREQLKVKLNSIDTEGVEKRLMEMWHIDPADLVDSL